jgi:TRAP-type C4-dicarboxylate transport system permease small subunit
MLKMILIAVRLIERLTGWAVALLVAIALVVVAGQFIDRHFFDLPWDSPDQFARITIIWLCFLGTALALSDGAAIRIDLFDHWLPHRVLVWRDSIFDVLLLAMLIILVVTGWTVVKVGSSQFILGTPFTADVPYSGLLVGSALGALFILARILRRALDFAQRKIG